MGKSFFEKLQKIRKTKWESNKPEGSPYAGQLRQLVAATAVPRVEWRVTCIPKLMRERMHLLQSDGDTHGLPEGFWWVRYEGQRLQEGFFINNSSDAVSTFPEYKCLPNSLNQPVGPLNS